MDKSSGMSEDKKASAEEQALIYRLMAEFAKHVIDDVEKIIITSSADDYFLVARLADSLNCLVYEIEIWRPSVLEDIHGSIFTVAVSPGITDVTYCWSDWNSIPVNNSETKSVYGPMWGLKAIFEYPEEVYEIEALYDRAKELL